MKTCDLNLEESMKIIALSKILGEHEHFKDEVCHFCEILKLKQEKYECQFELGWHFLEHEARGYFQGFQDATIKCKILETTKPYEEPKVAIEP